MRDLIILMCFMAVLLVPGEPLSCVTCQGKFGCTGPAQTCKSPGDVCLAIFVITTKGRNLNIHSFIRKCGSPQHCQRSGNMKTPNLQISFAITCCKMDSCTQEQPVFSVINPIVYKPSSDPETLCPTCDLSDPYQCTEQYAMPCDGSQDLCATLSETSANATTTIKGCATGSFCLSGGIIKTLEGSGIEVNLTCMNTTTNSSLPMHYFRYCSVYTMVDAYNVFSQLHGALCSPDEDACVMEYNRILYYGKESTEQIIRCGRSADCHRYGVITNPDKTIHFSTSCCYSDLCIVKLPTLPTNSPVKNGLRCKSCFSPTSDQCLVQDTMECTGNETSCVRYTAVEVTQGKNISYETLYGCATHQVCGWGNRFTNNGVKTVTMEIQCVDSGSGVVYVHQVFIIVIVSISKLVLFNP